MSKLWYVEDPLLLASIEDEIESNFSGLRLFILNQKVFIQGRFDVYHQDNFYDRYSIRIELADNHPISLPQVFEIGGRVPTTAARHVYEEGGYACLFVPFERFKYWPDSRNMSSFLGGPVNSYFYSQSFYDQHGYYPFGERSHNLSGVIESIKDISGMNSSSKVYAAIDLISKTQMKGHWDCPCNSGKNLKNCHFGTLADLKRVLNLEDLKFLKKWILLSNDRERTILQKLPT